MRVFAPQTPAGVELLSCSTNHRSDRYRCEDYPNFIGIWTHHLSPHAVLQLAADCFAARPSGWNLGIQPEDLESFAEGLTPTAENNLASAVVALRAMIEKGGGRDE